SLFFFIFLCSYSPHQDLPSFPTRRSSDLTQPMRQGCRAGPIRPPCAPLSPLRPADSKHRRGEAALGDPGFEFARPIRNLGRRARSEEHTSELQSLAYLVCRLLLEKKKKKK